MEVLSLQEEVTHRSISISKTFDLRRVIGRREVVVISSLLRSQNPTVSRGPLRTARLRGRIGRGMAKERV